MKLICPSCGATASCESWENDATARETVLAIASLPAPMHLSTLRYIALFRPAKSALSWSKALRLSKEVGDLAQAGYVSVQGQADKDCPPRIWAEAMDSMVERQSAIKRPLKSHSYLRQVAHGLATEYVKQAEEVKESAALTRTRHSAEPVNMADMINELTDEERRKLPKFIRDRHGVE